MILNVAISLFAVAAFAIVLWLTRIITVARNALTSAMSGLSTMLDSALDDDAKEVAVRRAGFALIGAGFRIFLIIVAALAAAALPIYLADFVGLASRDAVFALMLRIDYIVIVSLVVIVIAEIARRWRPASANSNRQTEQYSTTDRFFHIVAFSSPAVLRAASSIEDRLLSKSVAEPAVPPIFVTSLARGGTTALLNALHAIPGIATHTYRDMPFITSPRLWNRLSGGSRRGVVRRKRAHGDGLEIDLDSPEAFEEIVWKMFWPEKFRGDTIGLWTQGDRKADAEQFFTRHMAKIVNARAVQANSNLEETWRYCSKNNANIARIPYLVEAYPGCRIVVPVRRPESHAASLLRQHKNFQKLQAEDGFTQRYMRDIGHFEFGRIHKPFAFPGFDAGNYDPATPDYWLAYWIAAFTEVRNHVGHCYFVHQDSLRSAPQDTIIRLCDELAIPCDGMNFSSYFRSGPDQASSDQYDPMLLDEAASLYREFEVHSG